MLYFLSKTGERNDTRTSVHFDDYVLKKNYFRCSALYAMLCMRCSVCSALYAVLCMQCSVCSTLYAVLCMRCSVCSTLYAVPCMRCSVCGALYAVLCMQCSVCSTLYLRKLSTFRRILMLPSSQPMYSKRAVSLTLKI